MSVERLITDNIDVWTSTVKTKSASGRGSSKKIELYGIKKLRELILELAVRGKLVPQDPTDDPASVLLERIAEEKAQLVKERMIKKQKELPKFSEEEIPHLIPSNWSWCRLDDVCFGITSGSTPPKSNFNETIGVPYLKVYNIRDQKIDFVYKPQFVDSECHSTKLQRSILYPGDVVMNIVGPPLGKVAIIPEDYPEWNCNQAITFFRPIERCLNQYIYTYLRAGTFLKAIELIGTAGQDNISVTKSRSILLPTPPLAEQHRIVAKVDELMLLCDQLEQQTETSIEAHQTLVEVLLNTLTSSADAEEQMQNWQRISKHVDTLFTTEKSIDTLKQTILQLAVMGKLVPQDPNDEPAAKLLERIAEEKVQLIKDKKIKKQKALPEITEDEKPFDLPSGWEWERIGTFGIVGTGATPSRSNPKYWDSQDHNWVSSGETAELFVRQTKEKVSELAIKETNVSIYPMGTLIVAMYGQGKTRGQITELLEPAGTNQACAAIRLIEISADHKDFVKLYFRKAYEELRSNAAGGAQPNLNVGKVQNTVIAIPPIKEQQRINLKVDSLLLICNQLKSRLKESQTTQLHLTDAIIDKAL